MAALNDSFYNSRYDKKTFGYAPHHTGGYFSQNKGARPIAILRPLLMRAAKTGSAAVQRLSFRIISHRDISHNNVIWKTMTESIIIDSELEGLIHPTI